MRSLRASSKKLQRTEPPCVYSLYIPTLPTLHGHNRPGSIARIPFLTSFHHSALRSARNNRNPTQISPTACPETKISRCQPHSTRPFRSVQLKGQVQTIVFKFSSICLWNWIKATLAYTTLVSQLEE